MRATVIGSLLLAFQAGCDSVKTASEPAATQKEVAGTLPAPTVKLKVDAYDLVEFYTNQKASQPEAKHPHEGKRVVCRALDATCFGVWKEGKSVVAWGSEKMFRRPQLVFALQNNEGFQAGEFVANRAHIFFEGTIRGPITFASKPWAEEWLNLTPSSPRAESLVLIDEAIRVSPPKD